MIWLLISQLITKNVRKNIQIKCNETDQLLTQKFNSKLSGENDKVQELFSKNSKDFVKKIFQELFPKAPN